MRRYKFLKRIIINDDESQMAYIAAMANTAPKSTSEQVVFAAWLSVALFMTFDI